MYVIWDHQEKKRLTLILDLFLLQEQELKQKLLDPPPVRISQRFSEIHFKREEVGHDSFAFCFLFAETKMHGKT